MTVRQAIAAKPAVTSSVVGGLILLAIVWCVYVMRPTRTDAPTEAYFTDDDGKTTFVDSIDRIPPFDHKGKTAVRAMMFTVDDHSTSFVGYLERYTPDAARQLKASDDAVAAGKPPTANRSSPGISIGGTEFKKPGDAKWLSGSDLRMRQKIVKDFTPPGKVLDSVVP